MTSNQPPGKTHYRYSPCAYGRYLSGSVLTEQITAVTCKLCLGRIAKHQLRSRSEFPDVPTFHVHTQGRYRAMGGGYGTHLVFKCPVCGRKNLHGGTWDKPGAGDGHRVSHCDCWKKGYQIVEVPPEGEAQSK